MALTWLQLKGKALRALEHLALEKWRGREPALREPQGLELVETVEPAPYYRRIGVDLYNFAK